MKGRLVWFGGGFTAGMLFLDRWTCIWQLSGLYPSQLLLVTSWWSPLLDESMAFLVPHLISTSLPFPLFYSSSSGTSHIPPHTFLCLLLLLTTSSSSWLALPFSIDLYALLLVHYDVIRLSPLSVLHPLVYIPFFLSTPSLSLSVTRSLRAPLLSPSLFLLLF